MPDTKYFMHDYNNDASSWKGECLFRELEPENYREKNVWKNSRKKIYKVSITNFIKSLYHDSLFENGFLLSYTEVSNQANDYLPNNFNLVNPRRFLAADTMADSCKKLYIPSDSEPIILVCFGKPIAYKELSSVKIAQNTAVRWFNTGLYRNRIETPVDTVQIFSDGTFQNPLQITPSYTSNSLTGLNMMLPIEFDPTVDSGVITHCSME